MRKNCGSYGRQTVKTAKTRPNITKVSFPELVQLANRKTLTKQIGTFNPEDGNKLVSNRAAIGFAMAHQLERELRHANVH